MRKREIVIGDVHGCLHELQELVDHIRPTQDDHLIFVGDLINKGPFSSEVIDLVASIRRNTCQTTLLLGNHEERLLRWVGHQLRCIETRTANPVTDRSGMLASLASKLRDDQLEMLSSALLWTRVDRQACFSPLLIVHAGIEPGLKELVEVGENRVNVSGKRWRELEGLVRVRFVNAQGRRVRLGEQQSDDRFWADVYDGRFGFVVYGHEPTLSVGMRETASTLGIDLGCVYGGFLGAAIFYEDRPGWEALTVKARQRYWPVL